MQKNSRHKAVKPRLKYSLGLILPCLLVAAIPQTAFAEDDCTDAKQFAKAIKVFFKADAKLKNVIDPYFTLSMKATEGNPPFSGLLYRYEGEEQVFNVNEDNEVVGLELAVDKVSPKGELCVLVDGKTIEDTEESAGEITVAMGFPYINKTGVLTMDELLEGAKDGSKMMKSFAPPGLGFVVPKMKSLVLIAATPEDASPKLILMKNGEVIDGPEPIWLGKQQFFHLSDIKETKADALSITGNYNLATNFDFKDEEIMEAEKNRLEKLANPEVDGLNNEITPETPE